MAVGLLRSFQIGRGSFAGRLEARVGGVNLGLEVAAHNGPLELEGGREQAVLG